MVTFLHQGNIHTKQKLRVWRDQKCILLVGRKTIPVRTIKLPRLEGGGIGPRTESCVNWGGTIAMVPCLHQGNIHTQRKLRVWRDQKCILLVGGITPPTCAGRQTIPSRMMWCRAKTGKLGKLTGTYRHGNVFSLRQYLRQKEATGMERLEMSSASRCKIPTFLCGPSNYPISIDTV